MNVLIIDQSDCTRSIIRSLLAALGITSVAEAATGEEAIVIARQFKPDLLLIDEHAAAGRDTSAGDGFIDGLRSITAAPIIALLASGDRSVHHVGASARLVKPFNHAEIAAAINAVSPHLRAA